MKSGLFLYHQIIKLKDSSITTLEGHTQGVRCVRMTASQVATGSEDYTIMLWDIIFLEENSKCVAAFKEYFKIHVSCKSAFQIQFKIFKCAKNPNRGYNFFIAVPNRQQPCVTIQATSRVVTSRLAKRDWFQAQLIR